MEKEAAQISTRIAGGGLIASAGAIASGATAINGFETFKSLVRNAPVTSTGVLEMSTLAIGLFALYSGLSIIKGALVEAKLLRELQTHPDD